MTSSENHLTRMQQNLVMTRRAWLGQNKFVFLCDPKEDPIEYLEPKQEGLDASGLIDVRNKMVIQQLVEEQAANDYIHIIRVPVVKNSDNTLDLYNIDDDLEADDWMIMDPIVINQD